MAQSQDGVKFLHFRKIDSNGNVDPRGGTTIAYRASVRTNTGDPVPVIEYGVAKCHSNDNFVKSLGRAKAAGRLDSPSLRYMSFGDSEKKFAESVALFEADFGFTRKFARKSRKS